MISKLACSALSLRPPGPISGTLRSHPTIAEAPGPVNGSQAVIRIACEHLPPVGKGRRILAPRILPPTSQTRYPALPSPGGRVSVAGAPPRASVPSGSGGRDGYRCWRPAAGTPRRSPAVVLAGSLRTVQVPHGPFSSACADSDWPAGCRRHSGTAAHRSGEAHPGPGQIRWSRVNTRWKYSTGNSSVSIRDIHNRYHPVADAHTSPPPNSFLQAPTPRNQRRSIAWLYRARRSAGPTKL